MLLYEITDEEFCEVRAKEKLFSFVKHYEGKDTVVKGFCENFLDLYAQYFIEAKAEYESLKAGQDAFAEGLAKRYEKNNKKKGAKR